MGRYDEALEALGNARKINPQGTGVYLNIESRVLFLMERYEDALPKAEESAARDPGLDSTQLILAAIYTGLGRDDDASWAIEEALGINPGLSIAQIRRDSVYQNAEDLEPYLDALRKAGLPES